MPFRFKNLELPGAVLIEPRVFGDDRGFFLETYKRTDFEQAGIAGNFVQENQSLSQAGTLRGLHFQRVPKAQGKLVRVLSGEIFDAAVDIRRGSPHCGRWVGAVLSAENRHMLYVPPWCAHGFLVTRGPAEVLYKTTDEYSAPHESGFAWDDPAFAIDWPGVPALLAEKDRHWAPFEPIEWQENGATS
jgi:dTDP-4-dehydrorhamnose 3,5-epimerase